MSLTLAANPTKLRWNLVSAFLVVALSLEIYILLNDRKYFPNDSVKSHQTEPLAQLMRKENDVRVQEAGGIAWETAEKNDSLYPRESVRTFENSRAEIAFTDGLGILVDENSTIQVQRQDANSGAPTIITLLRGTLHKTRARSGEQSIQINLGQSERVLLKPENELTIAKTNSGDTKIELRTGELKIETRFGEKTIQQGSQAILKNGSAIEISGGTPPPSFAENKNFWHPEPPVPIFPAQSARILSGSGVDIAWKAVENAAGYEVEVQSKRDRTFSASSNSFQLKDLDSGDNSWRVRARLEDGSYTDWSESRTIHIQNSAPPPPNKFFAPEIFKK